MPKTILNAIRQKIKRVKLKYKGVIVHNNTVLSNVSFKGSALIEPYCRVFGDPLISLGSDFYMNSGCHLLGDISFGDHVMVGPKTVIWGRDHGMDIEIPMKHQHHFSSPIVIGDDVWISANVTILKGVKIGNGAVIGAGAVVIKDVPEYAIAVGNPARVVKYRK